MANRVNIGNIVNLGIDMPSISDGTEDHILWSINTLKKHYCINKVVKMLSLQTNPTNAYAEYKSIKKTREITFHYKNNISQVFRLPDWLFTNNLLYKYNQIYASSKYIENSKINTKCNNEQNYHPNT